MTRSRRRSTRSNPQPSPEPSPVSPPPATPAKAESPESRPVRSAEDTCPACIDNDELELNAIEKESWVRCDSCKKWYHWRCAGDGGDLEIIDKWFCKDCLMADPTRVITLKPPARKSSRKRTQRDYVSLNLGLESDPGRWVRILEEKKIEEDRFKRVKGSGIGVEWLESDDSAMKEPFVIEIPDGLGMKMPSQELTVDDVATLVGESTPVEVIDVASQSNAPGWTLGKWAEYYALEPSAREKILNVISLEISGTKLADQVLPPRLVRELDWVEKFWPGTRKSKGNAYPKVQLYCLMGVATAWTDWHIDFAGSSVYYHILHGSKVFYFIRPTQANLAAYERWSGTEIQNHRWLGDMVDEVIKITLQEGNTMIIPTGWIHAVYTPIDSLVFGGNFLHSYDIKTQMKVRDIEIATHVPKKFRFPLFTKLCWYVGDKYLRDLRSKEEFSARVLESLKYLADFLVSEARTMERGAEHAKREAKEQVPSDRVKDPAATARELRWRIKVAAGYASDDEDMSEKKKEGDSVATTNGTSLKRKRANVEPMRLPKFKHFQPRLWEDVVQKVTEDDKVTSKAPKPADDGDVWKEEWLEWKENANEGSEVNVSRRKEIIIKMRRTENGGLERQRVERIFEDWSWVEP